MAGDLNAAVTAALQKSLSADSGAIREATAFLTGLDGTQGIGFLLLGIVATPGNDLGIRQAASAAFKNFCKRRWDDDQSPIPSQDKDAVKAQIVRLMISSPPLVQKQLSDALAIISSVDFPNEWPTLLPELVAQLQIASDMPTTIGILETAAAVFERFRDAYDSTESRGPLRTALDQFGAHLPAIMYMLDVRIDSTAAAGGDKAAMTMLMHAQRVCINIMVLLSQLELPDEIVDHLEKLMVLLHKYLALDAPALRASAGDEEPGPLELLQSAVLDVVGLYSNKHDTDFEPYLETFVRDVWGLLAGSAVERMLSPGLDVLVTAAIKFLTFVAIRPQHKALFEQDAALRAILEGIVLPNIRLRKSDVELFEDNPIDFIRGDIEGSDSDTRRRTATDLVRALGRHLDAKVTPLCTAYVDQLLASYQSNPAGKEADKDAAVALVIAVAVKTATASAGATAVNPLFSLGDFLRLHVLSELQSPDGVDARPIARAAAIKFVATFRGLFGRDELHQLIPILAQYTNAKSYIVHTYAAGAIERILTIKDKVADGSSVPRVHVDAVAPVVTTLLQSLFTRMMQPTYAENEYLMRCVLRLVVFSKGRVSELTATLVSALTSLLQRVCLNPRNPIFNHLLFETIGALMRSVCTVRPESVADFEALLFPPFQDVLQRNYAEFFPYVFQLLAEQLELRPAPSTGGTSLTDSYRSLLPPMMQPHLWSNKGNIPALTELLSAYLSRGGLDIANSGSLPAVLTISQKLLTGKQQEQFAFAILNAAIEGVPLSALQPQLPAIVQMTMARVQEMKAIRVARLFVHTLALASGLHGPALLEGVINGFGPGLFATVLENVIVPMAKNVVGRHSRAETAIGLTRVLCESSLLTDFTNPSVPGLWPQLLATILELHGVPAQTYVAPRAAALQPVGPGHLFTEEEDEEAEAEAGMYAPEYVVAFSRLVHAGNPDRFAFKGNPAPAQFLAQSLAALCTARPGVVPALIASSPVAATVQSLCASAGVALR